jgi:2,3-bisphosphoglycerate-dependent phosphoglycerate mutase
MAGLLAILVAVVWIQCFFWPVQITSVYLIRHAEKVNASADPPLAPERGQGRAQTLTHILGKAGISAIFVTPFKRTQQTAAPLAAALGLTPIQYQATDAQGVAATILAGHAAGRVVVIAHSNPVDDVAAALGVQGVAELGELQFDRLFAIHRFANVAHLNRLRYGVEML